MVLVTPFTLDIWMNFDCLPWLNISLIRLCYKWGCGINTAPILTLQIVSSLLGQEVRLGCCVCFEAVLVVKVLWLRKSCLSQRHCWRGWWGGCVCWTASLHQTSSVYRTVSILILCKSVRGHAALRMNFTASSLRGGALRTRESLRGRWSTVVVIGNTRTSGIRRRFYRDSSDFLPSDSLGGRGLDPTQIWSNQGTGYISVPVTQVPTDAVMPSTSGARPTPPVAVDGAVWLGLKTSRSRTTVVVLGKMGLIGMVRQVEGRLTVDVVLWAGAERVVHLLARLGMETMRNWNLLLLFGGIGGVGVDWVRALQTVVGRHFEAAPPRLKGTVRSGWHIWNQDTFILELVSMGIVSIS